MNNGILNAPSSQLLKQVPTTDRVTFEDIRSKNDSLSRQQTAEINCQTFQRNTPDLQNSLEVIHPGIHAVSF